MLGLLGVLIGELLAEEDPMYDFLDGLVGVLIGESSPTTKTSSRSRSGEVGYASGRGGVGSSL